MQPEKMIVLGPIIIFFAIFGSLIIGFLVVVFKLVIKGKKSAWKGTLVDKMYKTNEDMDSDKTNHFYTLIFKTEEGKEIKIGTSKQIWDEYKIGDKAEKKSGEMWPKKVN